MVSCTIGYSKVILIEVFSCQPSAVSRQNSETPPTRAANFLLSFFRVKVSIRESEMLCFIILKEKIICNFWELCYDYAQRRAIDSEKHIEVP